MPARIARFLHSQGARAGIQLAHAGRKGSMTAPFTGERLLTAEEGEWTPVTPSPIAFSPKHTVPGALDQDGTPPAHRSSLPRSKLPDSEPNPRKPLHELGQTRFSLHFSLHPAPPDPYTAHRQASPPEQGRFPR